MEKKKGSGRMPGGPTTSLVCFAIHLGLFSASFGAAVDAPNTATESVALVKGGEVTEEVAESRGRFPRSVSDYQDSLDYPNKLSAYGAEDSGSRSRRRFSESEWKSDGDGEWELAAQVAKRGQRGRGEYYRGPAEEEVKLVEKSLAEAAAGAASTMLARQQRNGRRYDVPQIECPRSPDHMERFACPKPDRRGRFRCIDDRALCDGFYDCPDKEDENPDHCLFYKTTKAHLDILAEALLRWARGR